MTPEHPYPYRFDVTASAGELHERYASLEPGAGSGSEVAVAGRVMTVRSHGKVAFADLKDSSGRIQLFAQAQVLGDEGMDAFGSLNVGDIVGATGEVVMTKRGELSVRVAQATVLAKCRNSMPEKWHGLSDVEVRYRHRYLDLIINEEATRPIKARAVANAAIRRFFDERGFIEVETPLLQPIAGGAVARPFLTHHNALDIDLYLRVAPELYLKRLLIGGFERVYELNKSFRNEGVSTRHNPEFTMLEAYEAYVDYADSMTLVEDLVREIATAVNGSTVFEVDGEKVDLSAPFARIDMFEAIEARTGQDLRRAWEAEDAGSLRDAAAELDVSTDPGFGPGKVLVEIFEQTTERTIAGPTFITGFPTEVSPLAKDHRAIPRFTEHADLILAGIEIAPVYSELNDPEEQRRRFEQQAALRAGTDQETALPDDEFLEALAYGMPPAGGFGVGIDRLLMVLLGEPSIREVITFPTLKPEPR